MTELSLKFYKLNSDVQIPKMATQRSSCFDLKAFLSNVNEVDFVTSRREKKPAEVEEDMHGNQMVCIPPRASAKIPTGLVPDIPVGYEILFYPRSGNSFKKHLILANQTAVIDEDYVDEMFVLVYNRSDSEMWIEEGQKICQAKLTEKIEYELSETKTLPEQKTDRIGGFNSTGD